MAAVEQEFGCRIPMADLFEHETLEFVCAAVEDAHPEGPRELLFPIKRTGDLPPVYCVHMPGWSGFAYGSLARQMSSRRSMIGLLEHLDPEFSPDDSLKETASRYADAIQHSSDGPYHLLGASAAGVLAYEIGHQLTRRGAELGFVGMIDSGYPNAFSRLRHVVDKLRQAVDRYGVLGIPSLVLSRVAHRLRLRQTADGARLERARGVISTYLHHRVEPIDAMVTYFRASEGRGQSAAVARWWPLVSDMVDVDGTHAGPDSVLSAHHAAGLARALESALAASEKKMV
jgi:thioesterase domain-containing protein